MDFYSFAPIAAVLDAAYSVVTSLASFIEPVAGSASAALAVVLITLIVRAALIPVGASQVRAELTRRRLAPQLRQLQLKYKKNPELLQRKTMEFYQQEKASPLAGCLPTLLQAPVLSTVYGLFILATINGHDNSLLTQRLGGVPLGESFVKLVSGGSFWPDALVFLVLFIVIAGVAWLSRRVALRFTATAAPVADAMPPALQNMTGALSWLPFLTVIFAAVVPLAAALYLTVSTTWTLVERVILRRVLGARQPRL